MGTVAKLMLQNTSLASPATHRQKRQQGHTRQTARNRCSDGSLHNAVKLLAKDLKEDRGPRDRLRGVTATLTVRLAFEK